MSDISAQCKKLLLEEGVDTNSSIDFDVNGTIHTMTFEEIIDIYMKASDESKLVFLTSLKKSIKAKDMGVDKFFEGMGQLLLMTHLSKKI